MSRDLIAWFEESHYDFAANVAPKAHKPVTKRTQALFLTILAVPAAIGFTPARADDKGLVWGKAVDGFQMAISLDSTRRLPSGAPAIRLHIRNTSYSGRDIRLKVRGPGPPDTCTLHAAMVVDLGQEVESLTSNVLILNGSVPAATEQGEPDWGEAVNGLQMAISLGPTGGAPWHLPAITLHVRNVGAHDLRVALRGGSADTKPVPNGVMLNLTDSSGNTKQLTNLGPGPPYPTGCAGGVWIFLVPMIPGALYSVPLEFRYYKTLTYSNAKQDFDPGWKPGKMYTLQAVLKVDPEHQNLPPGAIDRRFGQSWSGTITSQGLEIHFPVR